MKTMLVSALLACSLVGGVALAADTAPADAGPKPFKVKAVACDRIVLTWVSPSGGYFGIPATTVEVKNEAGTTGLKLYVDRDHGTVTSATSWTSVGGTVDETSLPGSPRIDYVNCTDADPLGGIVIEYYDAKDWTP